MRYTQILIGTLFCLLVQQHIYAQTLYTWKDASGTNDAVLKAIRQAKQARKQAQESRRVAEDAIKEANQIKNETESFLEPWRGKKRIRKAMQLQIESRIEKANQVIANAEHLIDSANAAEKKAQAAEKKAQKTQDQFFEVYKKIISN